MTCSGTIIPTVHRLDMKISRTCDTGDIARAILSLTPQPKNCEPGEVSNADLTLLKDVSHQEQHYLTAVNFSVSSSSLRSWWTRHWKRSVTVVSMQFMIKLLASVNFAWRKWTATLIFIRHSTRRVKWWEKRMGTTLVPYSIRQVDEDRYFALHPPRSSRY